MPHFSANCQQINSLHSLSQNPGVATRTGLKAGAARLRHFSSKVYVFNGLR